MGLIGNIKCRMGIGSDKRVTLHDYITAIDNVILNDKQAINIMKKIFPMDIALFDNIGGELSERQIRYAQAVLIFVVDISWQIELVGIIWHGAGGGYVPNSFGSAIQEFMTGTFSHWSKYPCRIKPENIKNITITTTTLNFFRANNRSNAQLWATNEHFMQ